MFGSIDATASGMIISPCILIISIFNTLKVLNDK